MAARAYWQGQIRLALVSIPVEVYPAAKSGAAISFHQIHEPSGKRIRYEKVAQGVGHGLHLLDAGVEVGDVLLGHGLDLAAGPVAVPP